MTRIAVVDYGAGNLVSVEHALRAAGADVVRVRDGRAVAADGLVLPGVGAAATAMARITRAGLDRTIRAWLAAGRPFLGICLGMQLLYEWSEEGATPMLGVLHGRVGRLDGAPRLPHTGWNQVALRAPHPLFDGIGDGRDFYFVHSYAAGVDAAAVAVTEYGSRFASAIGSGATFGVQFHPERSGTDGLRLLANFVHLAGARQRGPGDAY